MPRSQSSSSSQKSPSHYRPVFPGRPPVPMPMQKPLAPMPMYRPPTTGQVLKESLTSGLGSGIGFSLGNRLMSNLFGSTQPPAANPSQTPAAPIAVSKELLEMKDNMQQCLEHMVEQKEELPLCFFLMKTDPQFLEFQQCMKTSGNQIHLCKEFLPHP